MIGVATKELLDKCPCCHEAELIDKSSDDTYGLAKVAKNSKLDDKDFIELTFAECPKCGAIFLFRKK